MAFDVFVGQGVDLAAAAQAAVDLADEPGLELRAGPVARFRDRGDLHRGGEGMTRVELIHRRLERDGPATERMRRILDKRTATRFSYLPASQ